MIFHINRGKQISEEDVMEMTMGLTNTHLKSETKNIKDLVKQQTKDMTMMLRNAEMLSERLDRYTDFKRDVQ